MVVWGNAEESRALMKEKERPGFFGVERSLASTLEEAGKEVDVHSENELFSRRCQKIQAAYTRASASEVKSTPVHTSSHQWKPDSATDALTCDHRGRGAQPLPQVCSAVPWLHCDSFWNIPSPASQQP
ncbi:uncharacterized protein AAG666_008481 isoform 1-T2 [Megaptera novaeangliae]